MELLTDTLIANLVKKPGNSPAFFYSAKSEVFLSSRLAIGGARWLLKLTIEMIKQSCVGRALET